MIIQINTEEKVLRIIKEKEIELTYLSALELEILKSLIKFIKNHSKEIINESKL